MEDIVDARTSWQLKAVCECANTLQHMKGTGVAGSQFAFGARVQGLHGHVKEAQPHPIAHRNIRLAMMSIIVLSGQLLCLEKMMARLSQDLIVGAE
jgi:hypothetical protein